MIITSNRIGQGNHVHRSRLALGVATALVSAAVLLAVGCGGGAAPASSSEKAGDVEILDTALSQELTGADAYSRGQHLLRGNALAVSKEFRVQEQEHADALTRAIRGLGGKTEIEKHPLDYAVLKTRADVLRLVYGEENALVALYMRAIPKLATGAPRSLLAAIAANEAEHLVILRQELGARALESVPGPFESGDSPAPLEMSPSSEHATGAG